MTVDPPTPGLEQRLRTELPGTQFTTAQDLGHRVEAFGIPFVPVQEVHTAPRTGHFVLRIEGLGEVHVHAQREQAWDPFQVATVRVEPRQVRPVSYLVLDPPPPPGR